MQKEKLSFKEKAKQKRITKKEERHLTKAERREKRRTWLFLLPSLLGVLLFFVLPFAVVVYYSLIDNPINAEFVGIDNFIMLFKNQVFMKALKNTGVFTGIAVPLAILIPLFFALLLDSKIPGKSIFRTILISPLMVPVASIVLIWQVLFHYNGGDKTVITEFVLKGEINGYIFIVGCDILYLLLRSAVKYSLVKLARFTRRADYKSFSVLVDDGFRHTGKTLVVVEVA